MNNYVISEQLAKDTITYLREQPYKDVANLVTQLTQLQLVNIVPPTDTKGGADNHVQSEKSEGQESNASEETKQESNG